MGKYQPISPEKLKETVEKTYDRLATPAEREKSMQATEKLTGLRFKRDNNSGPSQG